MVCFSFHYILQKIRIYTENCIFSAESLFIKMKQKGVVGKGDDMEMQDGCRSQGYIALIYIT